MNYAIAFAAGITGLTALSNLAAARDWTQFYAGVSIGADAFTGALTATDNGNTVVRGSGPFGGDLGASLTIGADYQLNKFLVLGAFAALDWSSVETSARIQQGGTIAKARAMDVENMMTVGARVGVPVTPNTLAYVLGGYSWMNVNDFKASVTNGGQTVTGSISIKRSDGFTFGAGIEHRLSDSVSLRAEYRTTAFGEQTLFEAANAKVVGDAQVHVARIGAAYRFGGSNADAPEAAPSRGWAGFQIGIGAGMDVFLRDFSVSGQTGGFAGGEARVRGLGGASPVGLVSAGYDVHLAPRIVAGGFVSTDFGGPTPKLTLKAQGQSVSADLLSLDRSVTLGGRVGVLAAPDVMVYALAGYTLAEFDDASITANGSTVFKLPFPTLGGLTAGVGFEKMLGEKWSVKTEYRYTNYESFDHWFAVGASQALLRFDPSSHAVNVQASYRFAN